MKKVGLLFGVAILLCGFALYLLLSQGSEDTADEGGPTVAATTCVSQLPAESRSAAIAAWVAGPLPSAVAGTQECDFYDFAWQSFLSLTTLVPPDRGEGPVFTHWGSSTDLFPPPGQVPLPYPGRRDARLVASPILGKTGASLVAASDPALVGDAEASEALTADTLADVSPAEASVPADDFAQAASLVPMTDERGRWLHYSVFTNRTEYEFVRTQGLYASDCFNAWGGSSQGSVAYDPTSQEVTVTCGTGTDKQTHLCAADVSPDPMPQLPTGSIELKVAWRVLETCDLPDSPSPCQPEASATYLTVDGIVDPYSPTVGAQSVTLGLVGFHVVTRTASYPDGIWATFEYQGNAPDCPGGQATGKENMFCTPCPVPLDAWDDSFQQAARDQAQEGDAILVDGDSKLACSRNPGAFNLAEPPLYVPGTGDGQCAGVPIATEVCREVPIPSAVAQLNTWVDEVLAQDAPVLANYELVGVMWFDKDCRADASCAEQGTSKLTNTTMETFEQALDLSQVNAGTGCLVCHSTNNFNPTPFTEPFARGLADRSLLFYRIRQMHGAECTAPPASYTCPSCSPDFQARLVKP